MFRRVQCEDFVGVGGEVSDLLATQQKEYESGNTFEFSPQVPAFLSKVASSLSHAYAHDVRVYTDTGGTSR